MSVYAIMIGLAVATLLIAACVAYVRRMTRQEHARTPPARPSPVPHHCASGRSWMPVTRTYAMKTGEAGHQTVAVVGPDGMVMTMQVPVELGVVVCEGVFCSECRMRLACANCGYTPVNATVLDDEHERMRILQCCADPCFADTDAAEPERSLS